MEIKFSRIFPTLTLIFKGVVCCEFAMEIEKFPK